MVALPSLLALAIHNSLHRHPIKCYSCIPNLASHTIVQHILVLNLLLNPMSQIGHHLCSLEFELSLV